MAPPPSALTPTQLGAYLSFTEVAALLRPAVEQQLRDAGELSSVQFQVLARLGDAPDGRPASRSTCSVRAPMRLPRLASAS